MAKTEIKNEINTNYLRRYPANYEFDYGEGFHAQTVPPQKKMRVHPSITDKESYRLQLVSMRGAMSALTPERQKGMYMFEDGKYDIHKDISHILRKDLSIVEIDEYIRATKESLETSDKALESEIKANIEALETKKKETIEAQKATKDSSSSSAGE